MTFCAGSLIGEQTAIQPSSGGSNPTPALQFHRQDWWVSEVEISVARALVEKYHYARGASNTRTFLHGLFRLGEPGCAGIAWWIPPTKSAALATFPEDWKKVLALSRLVIVPGIPKNACSFLLAKSIQLIDAKRWPCLVTYADTWRGHSGTIYKAAGWTYVGLTTPEATFTINGRMTARKAGGKTRTRVEMAALGAVLEGRFSKHKFVKIR